MRAVHRIVLLATLAAFGSTLAACSNFDPDKLDIFGLSEKKKLPGERKELFPGGVPGVTQGIPPEYMKGNQPAPDALQAPAAQQGSQSSAAPNSTPAEPDSKTAAVEPEPKPKPKPKPKAKPRTVSQPAQITVQHPPQSTAPWPQEQQPAPQQGQAPWPTQGQANTTTPWPSEPPSGSVSR